MSGWVLVAALLSAYPRSPARRCLEDRHDAIARAIDAAEREVPTVPPALLVAVGYYESWLGCHPRSGGCWGAPRDARHRYLAGTPADAARALARSLERCGDRAGAVRRFRVGLCNPRRQAAPRARAELSRIADSYTARVLALADHLEEATDD